MTNRRKGRKGSKRNYKRSMKYVCKFKKDSTWPLVSARGSKSLYLCYPLVWFCFCFFHFIIHCLQKGYWENLLKSTKYFIFVPFAVAFFSIILSFVANRIGRNVADIYQKLKFFMFAVVVVYFLLKAFFVFSCFTGRTKGDLQHLTEFIELRFLCLCCCSCSIFSFLFPNFYH